MKKIALVLAILAMAGCKPSNDQVTDIAKKEIREIMKDPDSAKFSDLLTKEIGSGSNGKFAYCVIGNVNGKNSFGAYSGPTPFAMTLVLESGSLPFITTNYQIGSRVLANGEANVIRYKAITQLCR